MEKNETLPQSSKVKRRLIKFAAIGLMAVMMALMVGAMFAALHLEQIVSSDDDVGSKIAILVGFAFVMCVIGDFGVFVLVKKFEDWGYPFEVLTNFVLAWFFLLGVIVFMIWVVNVLSFWWGDLFSLRVLVPLLGGLFAVVFALSIGEYFNR